MVKVKVGQRFTCKRCGHSWHVRKPQRPRVCPNPKCKSVYWDRKPRKR